MARYHTLDHECFDLDEVFADEERDVRLQLLDDRHIVKYRTKTIKSGDYLEVEIYPLWDTHSSTARAKKTRETKEAQRRVNQRNAVKNLIRLINANFTDNDVWGTFTYETRKLPSSIAEAQKEMQKYIRRVKYAAKKRGYPPVKYVYVTEFEDDPKKGKKRVHHHFVTNFPDRDLLEQLWTGGARKQTRRLQADESGYEGMTRYILKDPRGAKRYAASKGLTKPTISVADTKFTRRKIKRLHTRDLDPRAVFEAEYKGYEMTDFYSKTSEYVSGAYCYVKMRKRPIRAKGGRQNEIFRE